MLDKVLVFYSGGTAACSAASLGLVVGQRLRFGITTMRNGHNTIFFSNQILDRQVMCRIRDLGLPFIPEFFYQFLQLLPNDLLQAIRVTEYVEIIRNLCNFVRVLLKELFVLQPRQSVQPQIQNRLGLGW